MGTMQGILKKEKILHQIPGPESILGGIYIHNSLLIGMFAALATCEGPGHPTSDRVG